MASFIVLCSHYGQTGEMLKEINRGLVERITGKRCEFVRG